MSSDASHPGAAPTPPPVPPAAAAPAAEPTPVPASTLSPEEQMALFEKDLKENDWGHQPC
jgi:hypothetical protein